MSKYKDLMKNGWHPEKAGTSLKGQVSGLVHRGKKDDGPSHQARPISSLTDPSTFAAPPKRRGTGLAPAPPPSSGEQKRSVIAAPSKWQDPRGPKMAAPERVSHTEEQLEAQRLREERFGSPASSVSQQQRALPAPGQQQQQQQQQQEEEEEKPRGPYRVDTSGLSTAHLPKPPGRRDGADGRSPPAVPPPPSYDTALSHPQQPPKPSLPPRLPARTNAGSPSAPAARAPLPAANPLNQDAVSRLGNAGVSVPGLGIGGKPAASPSPPPPPRQPVGGGSGGGHLGELQNRFSKLNTGAAASPTTGASSPSEGTSWAQKQAALNTASSLQKDPSTVSAADARSAFGVANNFRQRHGDQVASGVRSANNLNQKYGVADRVGGMTGGGAQQQDPASPSSASLMSGLAGKKKPPPPPPKKKPGLGGAVGAQAGPPVDDDAPPPIPLSTRPTF